MVSIMWVNNEVGNRAAGRGRSRGAAATAGVAFHTDAVQAFGKLPVCRERAALYPAHPFRATRSAPPRASARWSSATARRSRPSSTAGGQQYGIRPGTENVAGAVALGRAALLAAREQAEEAERLRGVAGRAGRATARRACRDLIVNGEGAETRAARAQRLRRRGGQRGAADAPRSRRHRGVQRVGVLHRARWSPPTCWWPWACRAISPSARSASASATRARRRTSTRVCEVMPGVVAKVRQLAGWCWAVRDGAGAGGHVGRSGQLGGRRPPGRAGLRGGRRHHEALLLRRRRPRPALLLARLDHGRAATSPTGWAFRTTCSISRTASRCTSSRTS